MRQTHPRRQRGNFEKNVEAIQELNELNSSKGATVSQLALVPIPGSRTADRIAENAGAGELGAVSQ